MAVVSYIKLDKNQIALPSWVYTKNECSYWMLEVVMRFPLAPKLICLSLFVTAALGVAPARPQAFDLPAFMKVQDYPRPYCTNRGHRVELGQMSCLQGNDVDFLARCVVVLNNPSWQKVHEGCKVNFLKDDKTKP